jgi:ubiquinone/menaquinone biosynthesis C-methylase UbiE
MLKDGVRIIHKKGLGYTADDRGRVRRFKPWLGDSFSFLYDFIMKRSVFPRKFGADMGRHSEILARELKDVHGEPVLELATGSGSAVSFLPNDNQYAGTDVSPGLLRRAAKNFRAAGFEGAEFYVASAEDLPFADRTFSTCLCILSLNFFPDAGKVFQEVKRVLLPGGVFIVSVPVPERNRLKRTIHGTLHSEEELGRMSAENGFKFETVPAENGVLLYFKATSNP